MKGGSRGASAAAVENLFEVFMSRARNCEMYCKYEMRTLINEFLCRDNDTVVREMLTTSEGKRI